jgi:hypothetical protein
VSATEPVGGTIRVGFTMPADADATQYLIRWKAGFAQSFSSHTDGSSHTVATAADPSEAVTNVDKTGFTTGAAYTVGVFAGDASGNWSAAATDDLALAGGISVAPELVFEWDGVPEIWVEPPGEFEMAVTLSVDFNIGVSLESGSATFDSGDIGFTGLNALTNAGLVTFDAANPAMAFVYGLTAPGHIVCDSGVIDATGYFPAPVGRNKHDEQLSDAGPGDLVRGSIGTPGSTS